MCDPVSIGALALGTAGTIMQGREQQANMRRAVGARNDAVNAEMIRQRGFADQGQESFGNTLDRFRQPRQEQALADAVTSRGEAMTRAAAPLPNYAPVAGSAPNIVRGEIERKTGQAGRAVASDARRLGDVRARDDVWQGNQFALEGGRNALNTTGSFARGSAALLPGDVRAAETNAYRPPSGLGQGLRLAGMAGGLAGAAGGWDWLKNFMVPGPTGIAAGAPGLRGAGLMFGG